MYFLAVLPPRQAGALYFLLFSSTYVDWLSHFSGSYFFQEFVRVLHFRYFLAEQIRYHRRNRDYSISQMLLALVYPIVLGLDRIETASLLRSDGTFQYL